MSVMNRKRKAVSSKVLGIQKQSSDKILIGMSVHLDLHHYLTLYCTAKGVSKANVLKSMLSQWIQEKKEEQDDTQLFREIAQRAINSWRINKTKGDTTPLLTFKESLGVELTEKGFTEKEVKRILNEIKI
jgi:16S rRNA C967 or C1407 C5-methylase (RsmB/RsmF family)